MPIASGRNSLTYSRLFSPALFVLVVAVLGACADAPIAPLSGPTPALVAYCTGLAPDWVAFQDGDGPWTQALPTTDAGHIVYRRDFMANRGGIANVQTAGDLTVLTVTYGTPAELESVGNTNPLDCGSNVSKTLLGSVVGLDTNESAVISSGVFARGPVLSPARTSFAIGGLPEGPQDLLATRTTRTGTGAAITRIILRRGIDQPDSATIPALDFASAESFTPATPTLAIENLGGDKAISGSLLHTINSEMVLSLQTIPSVPATRPYVALPQSQLLPGDLQALRVATESSGNAFRTAELFFRSPTNRIAVLGAPLAAPGISVVSTSPSLRVRARFVSQPDYDRTTTIVLEQVSAPAQVIVSMTAAYAEASATGYDLIVPDLSAVPGFDPAWALRPDLATIWSANRIGGTLGSGRNVVPRDGDTQRGAFLKGTVTIP